MSTPRKRFWENVRRSFYLSSVDVGIERQFNGNGAVERAKDDVAVEVPLVDDLENSSLYLFAESVHELLDSRAAEQ